jgi:hypothetical protein
MALTTVDDSATIGTTEYYLASDSTTKTDQTEKCLLHVQLDFGNMAAGDQYRVRLYEKVNGTGATQRTTELGIVTGAQSEPFVAPIGFLAHGWEISVTKLAGTDRSIGWSLRKVT